MKTDLLIIGHVCHDLVDDKHILGGTASYVAQISQGMNFSPQILTSFGSDFLFEKKLQNSGIGLINQAQEHTKTTVFKNVYHDHHRTQYLYAKAEDIVSDNNLDINPSLVLLAPICQEVDFQFAKKFPSAITAATIQGWLRKWDDQGKITYEEMDWSLLHGIDIIFLSVDDVQNLEVVQKILSDVVPIVVITDGAHGAKLLTSKSEQHYPAISVTEVDATGAGDTFAMGFLSKYLEIKNHEDAMIYAHACSSFIVEQVGTAALDHEIIQARFEAYDRGSIVI